MKIGIFSTFIENDAFKLVCDLINNVKSGKIPNSEISFVFSNREIGDDKTTDKILKKLISKKYSLILLSSKKFRLDERKRALAEKKKGNAFLLRKWRNDFGKEVFKRLPDTDVDFLLGDMFIWGENFSRKRNAINLHPALPNGPKGEWYKVIWQLVREEKKETGIMMHKVAQEVDSGSPITFCRFPIRGKSFDKLWEKLPKDKTELKRIIAEGLLEKEKTKHPLHNAIRKHGFLREFPLVLETAKAVAKGSIKIIDGLIVNKNGKIIKGGYDLTSEINRLVNDKLN